MRYRDVFVIGSSSAIYCSLLPTPISQSSACLNRFNMSSSLNQQVQRLASRLKELSRDHPENNTLADAVSLLSRVETADSSARLTAWQAIEADIGTLQRRGVWMPSPEDEELLEHLKTGLHGTSECYLRHFHLDRLPAI